MKKLWITLSTFICAWIFIIGFNLSIAISINANIDKAITYNNIYSRNCSDYVMERVLSEKSILVLGSSELSAADDLAYPNALYNYGYADFNIVLMGAGYLQSLSQAINIGALQNNIKNNKVVLIVSPQWFTYGGVSSEAFSSRFEETNFIEFLKNGNISKETKIKVANRVNELLAADPAELKTVQKFEDAYLYKSLNPMKWIEILTHDAFSQSKLNFTILRELKEVENKIDYNVYVKADNIDYDVLLSEAQKIGEKECTNNVYGVYDYYFNTYIRADYFAWHNANVSGSYASSIEYDDLKLFLDVCKETGIEPLIVSVPVNGRWYDYTGFPKSDRNTYYQNIRDICSEYGVALADFSEKEYEIYFLKDIMHMGWKGWCYFDKAVYGFYKNQEYNDNTIYEKTFFEIARTDSNVTICENGELIYKNTTEGNNFNGVVITTEPEGTILDNLQKVGNRTGMFLYEGDSGNHQIRIRANANLHDENVVINAYLEKGCAYKLKYSVNSLTSDEIKVSDFTLYKVIY